MDKINQLKIRIDKLQKRSEVINHRIINKTKRRLKKLLAESCWYKQDYVRIA